MMSSPTTSTTLLLAPVGAGKTETALTRLLDVTRARPFARAWVLLPSERQLHAFRQRMVAHSAGRRSFFNIEFFNFYKLYTHLLDASGQPQRCLDEPARLRLLRKIMGDLRREGKLPIYSSIAHTPGFIRIMADAIYELKQNLVEPTTFLNAAQSRKDMELAHIYGVYQSVLQSHDLVDREGEGWLALDALRADPTFAAALDLLVVDGYDQFNPLQAQLLTLLAGQAREALVTLTTVPGREQTIGRRFEQAYRILRDTHARLGQTLDVVQPAASLDDRHPALRHLVESIFRPHAGQVAMGGGVQMVEAPEPLQEVGAVLRRVKQLLLDGCRPNDIVIALRDWTRYASPLATKAQEYGMLHGLAMQYTEPLGDNPAMTALLDLLDLHMVDFRRRNLLDVLRSPYFKIAGLDGEWIDQLGRVSQALRVTGGRKTWLEAVSAAATTLVDPEDTTSVTVLSAQAAKDLEYHLTRFFDRVTPPPVANVTAYVRWLEMVIGEDTESDPDDEEADVPADVASLEMIVQVRKRVRPGLMERDLAAMARLKEILRDFMATQELFNTFGVEESIPWSMFIADLRTSIGGTAVQRAPSREGRVLVTTVTDARGLPHAHVFILGLSEGVFPARVPEDPLYLDSERRVLTERGVLLQTQAERADDDGLFYELISLARESVTLSRSYIQGGQLLPESHLWRVTAALFSDAGDNIRQNRVPLAGVVPAREAASRHEAVLAAAEGLTTARPDLDTLRLYNWLVREHDEYWSQVWLGRRIEVERMLPRRDYDHYSGRLSHPLLIEHVAAALSPKKAWSATQLNDLGICGFRYYAGRLLKLETMTEPEDGMSVLQVGSIYHEILEQTYHELGFMDLPIVPENTDTAVAVLHEVAKEKLRDAPKRHGFQPSALWEQEKETLLRKLDMLVRADFSAKSPLNGYLDGTRVPYRQEVAFGMSDDAPFTIIIGGSVGELRVRGKIDRIDRAGDKALIVDYKSGSTKIDTKELTRGRNFQMMLYRLAAEKLLADMTGNVLGFHAGVFLHIGGQGVIGELKSDEPSNEATRAALRHLDANITRGREGNFAPHANKLEEGKCARYCEFSTMCRVSIVGRRNQESVS